jgi:hypothetical protein
MGKELRAQNYLFDLFYVDILGRTSEGGHLGTTGVWS